jgi:replication-associated recombination protein RarA
LDVTNIIPQGEQIHIISDIISIFNKKRRAVIFLHGVSGAGKSTVGILLAKELDGSFCHTFNPTTPGDNLHSVARDAEIGEEDAKPLVIVIEEANTLIRAAHTNTITLHKDVQTLVYNKSTYNTFLDDMILYENVVLILTSNESIEQIAELDPCYLRKGRIDASYSMMKQLEI